MNSCNFVGRLTRDVELKYLQDGTAVCNFSIAVYHNKEKSFFFDMVAWRSTAEFVSQNFGKGDVIAVTGSATVESWEKDGQKRSKTVFVVDKANFVPGTKNTAKPKDEPAPEPQNDFVAAGVGEDDLPF